MLAWLITWTLLVGESIKYAIKTFKTTNVLSRFWECGNLFVLVGFAILCVSGCSRYLSPMAGESPSSNPHRFYTRVSPESQNPSGSTDEEKKNIKRAEYLED